MVHRPPTIPDAPTSITKGTPLKGLLGLEAVECLARNIRNVHTDFEVEPFIACALDGLESLELMQRGQHIAKALHLFLPDRYADAIAIIVASLTPARLETDGSGLAEFFYLPHSFFIAEYGQDRQYNGGEDPFEASMMAMRELTTRFTSEFAIRTFLIHQQNRTLEQVTGWLADPNPHVRRFCSEGTRPRLPWGKRIPSLITDPQPLWPILEALKDDASLYVRRSVANSLGDIAKDHPEKVFAICERWLEEGASPDLKWLVRHAVRHPAKKEHPRALDIRRAAK